MMLNVTKRDKYDLDSMIEVVKSKINGMNISEFEIETVIRAYVSCKKDVLANGGYITEPGIGTTSIQTRGVPTTFTKVNFTVKLVTDMDYNFKKGVIEKISSDEEYSEVIKEKQS